MRNYNKALLIVAILLVGGVVGFFVYGFTTSGSIEDSFNFSYDEPISPDPIEDLTINVGIGSIIFQYNTTTTPSYAEIDVFIEISGWFIEGKTYLDFFNPSTTWWDNTTATFNLQTLPDVWFDPSHWFKSYNVTVIVTLRTDIVYDITALTSVGDIEMNVLGDATLNVLSLTSSTGSIKLETTGDNKYTGGVRLESSTGEIQSYATNTNFSSGFQASTSTGDLMLSYTNCIMGDDLIGTVSTGDVTFRSHNMTYSKESNLNLETSTGDIDVGLYQYNSMGANVSGTWETSTGDVDVTYIDTLIDTGFRFVSSIGTGTITYTGNGTLTGLGSIYTSVNYGSATYRYTFSLDTSTGHIDANAQSA